MEQTILYVLRSKWNAADSGHVAEVTLLSTVLVHISPLFARLPFTALLCHIRDDAGLSLPLKWHCPSARKDYACYMPDHSVDLIR